MTFSKSFPKTSDKYTVWEEIFLTDEEEKEVEEKAKKENIELMKKCLGEAKKICNEAEFKECQRDITRIAIALFEKRASHQVYHKERKCKEKFEEKFRR